MKISGEEIGEGGQGWGYDRPQSEGVQHWRYKGVTSGEFHSSPIGLTPEYFIPRMCLVFCTI